jgi:ketosteroid isomerase-like protein
LTPGLAVAGDYPVEPGGALTTQTSDIRLQQLIDAEEIRRLIYDYAFHLDMNHPDELANLFVEDCEVIYGPNFGAEGIEAYKKTLEGIGEFFTATSHHVSNIVIDFVGEDEAHVRSVLYAFHRYTRDRPDSHVWGQYHDVIVRVDGQWRFKRRELRSDATKEFHVKQQIPLGRA